MLVFDKHEIRASIESEDIFNLLTLWGGEPERASFGFISSTICHNPPGEGSHKLYYYFNSGLFHCYTGCAEPSFDIFQLFMKVSEIQQNRELDLNDAIRWIAQYLGISGTYQEEENEKLEDWKYLSNYDRIQQIETKENQGILKEYDTSILARFNYNIRILDWEQEGIKPEIIRAANIGYYPGGNQITIPHYDQNGRLIGLRGRSLSKEDSERFGKYRPLKVNKVWYNHPLGLNLYGLNQSKDNIRVMKKAIVFEGEKSQLLYSSYFGLENNISVACCGSNLSAYQVQLLLENGAQEIIVSFDRQFQEIGDEEFKKLKANLLKIREKYKNDVMISFIFDKNMITDYKSSPIDHGPEIFMKLFKERIIL